ncbi:MAG: 50S ribosomal protein L7, partial [Oscillospiraceae bacterium]
DAAENTFHRASNMAEGAKFSCLRLPFTKAELGRSLGRASCAVLAVTDVGFASTITKKLAAESPAEYGDAADALDKKAAKARLRQKEQAAHEKALLRQTRNPWVPPTAPKPKKH